MEDNQIKALLKTVALLLLLFSIFLTSGCVKTVKSTAVNLKTYDRLPASSLLEKVNSLQSINTLTANASIRVTDLKLSEQGKIEPYHPADGLIVLQRPEQIRMLIRVPVIKQNIADMTSDGEQFKIAIYYPDEYKQFLVGTNNSNYEDRLEQWKNDNPDKQKISSFVKIRPHHITEALLLKTVDLADGQISYFISDTKQEEEEFLANGKTRRVVRNYQVLHVLEKSEGQELKLQRQFWFDRTQPSIPLAKALFFGANGSLTSEVSYKRYQKYEDGTVWPQIVELTRAQDRYSLELTFSNITHNNEINKRAFVLENDQKLPLRDLDTRQQTPRTSPDQ
ncbi:MAG: hypothetical protein JNN15_00015 [Blastocatellia bacterium]|nr:hypothetical protein [Blastocatellia bacterium]